MPPKRRPDGTFGVVGLDTGRFSAFAHSCGTLRLPQGWTFESVHNYDCASACNLLVERFKGEYLMLMGDDHIFPPDLVQRLLAHDLDIVAPLCLTRHVPFEPVMWKDGSPLEPEGEPGLVEVDETGTAGMLVHRKVFEAIEPPWFWDGSNGDGERISDDIFFCRKAREAGFKIHVDTATIIGHLAVLLAVPFYDGSGWKTRLSVGPRELVNVERVRR